MPTVDALVDQIRNDLGEPAPGGLWTNTKLRQWISEANRDIARVTHHYKDTATIPTVIGQAEYAVPTNVIAIEHVYYVDTDQDVPLEPVHYEQMDGIWGYYRNREGGRPMFYTTLGRQPVLKLRIFPVPSAVRDLSLMTAVIPDDLDPVSGGSDPVDVPGAWYDALTDYVLYKSFAADRNMEMANHHLEMFAGKRDAMLHNNDYLPIQREIVVASPRHGYMPSWLVSPY